MSEKKSHDEELLSDGVQSDSDQDRRFVRRDIDNGEAQDSLTSKKPEKKPRFFSPRKEKTSKKKPNDNLVSSKLTEIYRDSKTGEIPDMTTFKVVKDYRLARALLFFVFTIILLGGVGFAWMTYGQPRLFASTKQTLEPVVLIEGLDKIDVGAKSEYRLIIKNPSDEPLAKTRFSVRLPDGFRLESVSLSPENPDLSRSSLEWVLGSLPPFSTREIILEGRLYGDREDEQSLRAFFTYKPANFNSDFQKVAVHTVKLNDSSLRLAMTAPTEVSYQSKFFIEARLDGDNTGFGELSMRFLSDDFEVVSSSLPARGGSTREWTVAPSGTLKIEVLLRSASTLEPKAQIKLVGYEKVGDSAAKAVELDSAPLTFTVNQVSLVQDLVINGTRGGKLEPGENLFLATRVRNNGDVALENLTVRLIIEAPSSQNKSLLDWTKLEDPLDGRVIGEQIDPLRRRGTITWTKANLPALAKIAPGAEAAIDISLPLKNAESGDISLFELSGLKATLETRFRRAGSGVDELLVLPPLEYVINSDLALAESYVSEASGANLAYTANLLITNTFHELRNLVLEADLYGEVVWNDALVEVGAGKLSYDSEKKKIRYEVESVPLSLDVLPVRFGFTYRPNPSQTALIANVRLRATDTVTGFEIIKAGQGIPLRDSPLVP